MNYMQIHVLMSLFIVAMKVWAVTVTSPQLVHLKIAIFYRSSDPTISTPIFPHI